MALVALAAFSVLSGCDDDGSPSAGTSTTSLGAPTTSPRTSTTSTGADVHTIEVEVRDGTVVGGARRESVDLGQRVRLVVTTAGVAGEVHVHGYDLTEPTRVDGTPVTIEFVATLAGVWDVELEGLRLALVELRVQ